MRSHDIIILSPCVSWCGSKLRSRQSQPTENFRTVGYILPIVHFFCGANIIVFQRGCGRCIHADVSRNDSLQVQEAILDALKKTQQCSYFFLLFSLGEELVRNLPGMGDKLARAHRRWTCILQEWAFLGVGILLNLVVVATLSGPSWPYANPTGDECARLAVHIFPV